MPIQHIYVNPSSFGCADAKVVGVAFRNGEAAAEGMTLIECECDKSVFEVTMPAAGTVEAVHVQVADILAGKTLVASVSVEKRIDSHTGSGNDSGLTDLKQLYPSISQCPSVEEAVAMLSDMATVRPAVGSDAAALARIYGESSSCIPGYDEANTDHGRNVTWFQNALLSHSRTLLVCELMSPDGQSKQIGFCNVEEVNRAPSVTYYLIGLYVAGPTLVWTSGRTLVDSAFEFCRASGIQHLIAFTHARNTPALKLLARCGFTEVGEFRKDPNYNDAPTKVFEVSLP